MGVSSIVGAVSRSRHPAAQRRAMQSITENINSPSGDILGGKYHAAQAYNVTPFAVGAGYATVNFTDRVFDSDAMWNGAVVDRLTIRYAGLYLLQSEVHLSDASALDIHWAQFIKNGASLTGPAVEGASVISGNGWSGNLQISRYVLLSAGDYTGVQVKSSASVASVSYILLTAILQGNS